MARKISRSVRLASGGQLWVLNRSGLLRLVDEPDEAERVSSAQGDAAIKHSMARHGDQGGSA